MREDHGFKVKFMLMNSFSTSADTLAFFEEKYPELGAEEGLEMIQNKVPKLDATTFEVSIDTYCMQMSTPVCYSYCFQNGPSCQT